MSNQVTDPALQIPQETAQDTRINILKSEETLDYVSPNLEKDKDSYNSFKRYYERDKPENSELPMGFWNGDYQLQSDVIETRDLNIDEVIATNSLGSSRRRKNSNRRINKNCLKFSLILYLIFGITIAIISHGIVADALTSVYSNRFVILADQFNSTIVKSFERTKSEINQIEMFFILTNGSVTFEQFESLFQYTSEFKRISFFPHAIGEKGKLYWEAEGKRRNSTYKIDTGSKSDMFPAQWIVGDDFNNDFVTGSDLLRYHPNVLNVTKETQSGFLLSDPNDNLEIDLFIPVFIKNISDQSNIYSPSFETPPTTPVSTQLVDNLILPKKDAKDYIYAFISGTINIKQIITKSIYEMGWDNDALFLQLIDANNTKISNFGNSLAADRGYSRSYTINFENTHWNLLFSSSSDIFLKSGNTTEILILVLTMAQPAIFAFLVIGFWVSVVIKNRKKI